MFEIKYNSHDSKTGNQSAEKAQQMEALSIAISARQVKKKELHNPLIGLFSEDLY